MSFKIDSPAKGVAWKAYSPFLARQGPQVGSPIRMWVFQHPTHCGEATRHILKGAAMTHLSLSPAAREYPKTGPLYLQTGERLHRYLMHLKGAGCMHRLPG